MPAHGDRKKWRSSSLWLPVALPVALPLAVAAACSGNHGTAPAATVPAFEVVGFQPADGSVEVDPGADVRITFSELVAGLTVADFTVGDRSGAFAGTLSATPDGRTWSWRPFRELPRGGRIEVRLPAGLVSGTGARLPGARAAAFTIREAAAPVEHGLGLVQPGAIGALAWPLGTRAVGNGDTLFELDRLSVTPWPVPLVGESIGFVSAATGFAALGRQGYSGFVLELARGEPGNTTLATLGVPPCAYGRSELVASPRGDLAVYWYGLLPNQSLEGVWVSRVNSASWTAVALPAAGTYPLRHLAVDGQGNVFVGFVNGLNGRLMLQRHATATGQSEVFDVAELPDSFSMAAAANGDARLVWRESLSVQGTEVLVRKTRRYQRGVGLLPAVELHRGGNWIDHSFAMASSGAAVVVGREPTGGGVERLWLQRIEVDGSFAAPELLREGPALAVSSLAISPRGEAWFGFVQPDAVNRDALVLVRSRPGADLDPARTLFTADDPTLRLRKPSVAVDESGRGVVAFTVGQSGAPESLRALVID